MKPKKYPDKLPVKFRPTSERPRYRDAGTGIDTNNGLDWVIDRKDAIYLITYFPENWTLNKKEKFKGTPKVSAVMPTFPAREKMARFAIRSFLEQTWPNKELIIVNEGKRLTNKWDQIKEVLVPEGLSNAAKHNVGDSLATGDYIIRWDDDDIYHPKRIEVQMSGILGTGALAATLGNRIHWLIDDDIAWTVNVKGDGTVLYQNEGKQYLEEITGGGSDSNFYRTYYSHLCIKLDNWPGMYIRTWHGGNICTKNHIKAQLPAGLKPGERAFDGELLEYFERVTREFKEKIQ